MSGYLLPTPSDPGVQDLIDAWPVYRDEWVHPRSIWLGVMEELLRRHYPAASSNQLTYTARALAPFQLARPGVP